MEDRPSAPADSLKPRLIALLRQAHADERALDATLSLEERARTGAAESWAPKEVIAHNAFWRERQIERVNAVATGAQRPSFADFERMNTESFPELAALTWEQALNRSARATDALVAAIEALPEAALLAPESSAQNEDSGTATPFIASVIGNGYQHPEAHLAEICVARGDKTTATRIQHGMAAALDSLGVPPTVIGAARYNYACFLVGMDEREQALEQLRLAFAQHPALVAWSTEDTDLEPLRDDPTFVALTTGGAAAGEN